MKRGILLLISFLFCLTNLYADDSCTYNEYNGIYDYVHNPTDFSDIVIIRHDYNIEYNGTKYIDFHHFEGRSREGYSTLSFSRDGTKWGIVGKTLDGRNVIMINGEMIEYDSDLYRDSYEVLSEYLGKDYFNGHDIMFQYAGEINNSENTYTKKSNFNIDEYSSKYNEIIVNGYSKDYNKYAFIGRKENGDYEIKGFELINGIWKEYNLIYNYKNYTEIYYVKFHEKTGGYERISILTKNKNEIKNVFDGHDRNKPIDISSDGLLIGPWDFGYNGHCTFSNLYGDLCTENSEYGLIDMKKNGYATYRKGIYKLFSYGSGIPIHTAFKQKNINNGKEYIMLDGIKGKEYDRIFTPEYLYDTGILSYFAYLGDTQYYIEHSCN